MRLTRSLAAGVMAMSVLAGSGALVPEVAGAGGAFEGVAVADGFRLGLVTPGAPVADQLIDLGGPSTQAVYDSLGTSRSFAAFPYPGQVVTSASGLVAGFTGGDVSPPDYPAHVAAHHPGTPDASIETPAGYRIAAHADADGATGDAVVGLDGADVVGAVRAQTSASVASDGPDILATAVSETDGVEVGPLRLGSVRSIAEARLTEDGQVERTATLEISGASIEGTPIGLGPDGITFLGTTTPLPGVGTPVDLLAGSGITLVILEAVETDRGVSSGAIQVKWTGAEVPGSGSPEFVLTVGRSSASLLGSAPPPPITASHPTPASPAGVPSTSRAPSDVPLSSPAPVAPSEVGDAPSESASPVAPEPQTQKIRQTTGPVGFDLSVIYLVVAFAGLVGSACAALVRIMGVRLLWTS